MKETPKGKNAKANKMTKTSSATNTSMDDKSKTTDEKKKGDSRADVALTGRSLDKKSHHSYLPLKYYITMFTTILLSLRIHQI